MTVTTAPVFVCAGAWHAEANTDKAMGLPAGADCLAAMLSARYSTAAAGQSSTHAGQAGQQVQARMTSPAMPCPQKLVLLTQAPSQMKAPLVYCSGNQRLSCLHLYQLHVLMFPLPYSSA